MNTMYLSMAIVITALCTYLTRGIPYVLFRKENIPSWVRYLSRVLPSSIMIILVVYCVKHIDLRYYPFGGPELISVAFVALIQYTKKNLLISIVLGTLLYMTLVGLIF